MLEKMDFNVKVSRATMMLLFLMTTVLFIGSFLNRMGIPFLRDNIDQLLAMFALGIIASESRNIPPGFGNKREKWFTIAVILIALTLGAFILPPMFGMSVLPVIVMIAPFVSLMAYVIALFLMLVGRRNPSRS